jgi:hypothetical protein
VVRSKCVLQRAFKIKLSSSMKEALSAGTVNGKLM